MGYLTAHRRPHLWPSLSPPHCVDTPSPSGLHGLGLLALPFVWVGEAVVFVLLAARSCSLLACVRFSSPSRSLWDECTRVLGGRCM